MISTILAILHRITFCQNTSNFKNTVRKVTLILSITIFKVAAKKVLYRACINNHYYFMLYLSHIAVPYIVLVE